MKPSILIVEDEEKIARVLEIELEYEDYQVSKAMSGTEGLEAFQNSNFDLVLLDIMLPGLSGIEVLRRIRSHDEHIPVILLTAKGSVEDKVSGLDLGATDYVTKPFQIEELLARIRAALRLHSKVQKSSITGTEEQNQKQEVWLSAGDLRINEKTREVLRAEDGIELTPREFDLLVYLLRNQRQVLNREQILESVWGYDYMGDTNVVDVYIRYLRKKIDHGRTPLIHTVRGVGYVLRTET